MAASKQAAAPGGRNLTPKQQRFVEEYLVDLNATAAYKRAGYAGEGNSAEVAAHNLLRNIKVAEAVAIAQQRRSERTEITQDRVLQEYAKIAFADIRKAVKWGESVAVHAEDGEGDMVLKHSVAVLASTDIDDDTACAISEVSQGKEGLKIKMHDKKGALDSVARHLGMFIDKTQITGPDGGPVQFSDMTKKEFGAIAREMADKV